MVCGEQHDTVLEKLGEYLGRLPPRGTAPKAHNHRRYWYAARDQRFGVYIGGLPPRGTAPKARNHRRYAALQCDDALNGTMFDRWRAAAP